MKKVAVKNFAGDRGGELLRWFTDMADPELLSSWKGVGGGGNCFHATMCAAAIIIRNSESLRTKDKRRLLDSTRIVTGKFSIPEDMGGGIVDHAWIEKDVCGEIIALNVSNLGDGKPLYVIPIDEYRRINECTKIHQDITLRKIYNAHKKSPLDPYNQEDIRGAVNEHLAETLKNVSV